MTDEEMGRRYGSREWPDLTAKPSGLDWFVSTVAPACVLLTILMVLWLVVL